MKLLCTNCRQHYKRYGEMPLLPGMVRDGREFSFRPISPEGLTGGTEDVDSDGRGLDNRLSPADRGKIFLLSLEKYIYLFPSSWRGERQWPELHEFQERVRVSQSGGCEPRHHSGGGRAGQGDRAGDLQRCRQQPGGASQPQCGRAAAAAQLAGPASPPAAAPVTPAAPGPSPSHLAQRPDPGGSDLPQPGAAARGSGLGAGARHDARHSVSAVSGAETGGRGVSPLSVRHLCSSLQQRR